MPDKVLKIKYGKESVREIVFQEGKEVTLSEEVYDILFADPTYDADLPEGLAATLQIKRAAKAAAEATVEVKSVEPVATVSEPVAVETKTEEKPAKKKKGWGGDE